jgi:hypothetical protein
MAYEIILRQSTYCDLKQDNIIERVHFKKKEEFVFVSKFAESFCIVDNHPVLLDYQFDWREIYIVRPVSDVEQVVDILEQAIDAKTEGWRTASRYYNKAGIKRILRDGYGKLLGAPIPIVEDCCKILSKAGAEFSHLDSLPSRCPRQALILGKNFVVAESFRVEELGKAKSAE